MQSIRGQQPCVCIFYHQLCSYTTIQGDGAVVLTQLGLIIIGLDHLGKVPLHRLIRAAAYQIKKAASHL